MSDFGQLPNGQTVTRLAIAGGGLSGHVLTYGAVLQDLYLEDHDAPLVLGFDKLSDYLDHSPYFGATAGRCANRIRGGHLELDGQSYQLDTNFLGKHTLHGGALGMGKRLWSVESHAPNAVELSFVSPDGDMGFPGDLAVKLRIALLDGAVLDSAVLDIQMEASTNAKTLCNLAHHSYFVLDDSGDVRDHRLVLAAEHYTPVDDELIPTGQVASVANTRFDFRQGARVAQAQPLLDHNFCLSTERGPLRPVAWLSSDRSGVSMELRTTEPGLQVYDGAKVNTPVPGLTGCPMGAHAGMALEPQVWPDAHHHAHFPQAILEVGQTYRQHSQFIFSRG